MYNNIVKIINIFAKFIKHHIEDEKISKNKKKIEEILNDMLQEVYIKKDILANDVLEVINSKDDNILTCSLKGNYLEDYFEIVCKKNLYIINEVHRDQHSLRYKTRNIYMACLIMAVLNIEWKIPNFPRKYLENKLSVEIRELNEQKKLKFFRKNLPLLLKKVPKFSKNEYKDLGKFLYSIIEVRIKEEKRENKELDEFVNNIEFL